MRWERRRKRKAAYAGFWEAFGPALKEGLYEDFEHREKLLNLVRFRTTAGDELVTLAEYTGMKEGRKRFTTSRDERKRFSSPQLEGFRRKASKPFLMTDPIDNSGCPLLGLRDNSIQVVPPGQCRSREDRCERGDERRAKPEGRQGHDRSSRLLSSWAFL
ncbi:MAG: hypothetical protein CM15mP87_01440 [Candidatus Neomarinimicrobiota bacterium]|nr:MAG: hypothetical protein CM15mP87_01440 [Candidatus Neomarinimicrobiota bacterium]